MENVSKLMKMVFAAIIFCIGTFLMLYEAKTFLKVVEEEKDLLKNNELYQQNYVNDNEIVSYAELIATLMQPLDYDIMIDGIIINRIDINANNIGEYNIQNIDYKKSYIYDENGEISFVAYTDIH